MNRNFITKSDADFSQSQIIRDFTRMQSIRKHKGLNQYGMSDASTNSNFQSSNILQQL